MTIDQAEEIVGLIRAATASRVEQTTVDYFQAALHSLNYESALQAATIGTVTWRRFPSWADFKEIYRAQEKLREPVGEQRVPPAVKTDDDEFKRGDQVADWVHVWSWCRLARNPIEDRPFPQQEGWGDLHTMLTTQEYEALHAEWLEAGSPKSKNPIPMAR